MNQFYIWLTSVCKIATFGPVEEVYLYFFQFNIAPFLNRIAGTYQAAFAF